MTSAVELSGGLYNSTYQVEIRGAAPVILRVAPAPSGQSRPTSTASPRRKG